jgi:hypothetical protein
MQEQHQGKVEEPQKKRINSPAHHIVTMSTDCSEVCRAYKNECEKKAAICLNNGKELQIKYGLDFGIM